MVSLDGGPEEDSTPRDSPEKGPAVDEIVAQHRDSERLRQAVDGLQEVYRSIFVLHYYQHLPLKEVSRRLSKPLGTVKVYLHRARKRLSDVLAADPVGARSSKLFEGSVP